MSDDQNPLDQQSTNQPTDGGVNVTSSDSSQTVNPPANNDTVVPAEYTQASDLSENKTSEPVTDNFNNPSQFNQESVITAPHAPQKYGGKKIIATIFGILVLLGGLTAGIILVQNQQNLNEQAASGSDCDQSPDCELVDDAPNNGSHIVDGQITYVDITDKEYHRYFPGDNDDGCRRVNISGNTVTWEKYGDGPNCKDISNVQIKFQGSMEFIKICHFTSDPSEHPWQAIEISKQAWDLGHDDAHDFKKTQYDFLYANTDPTCIWPEPGNFGITCADIWCENNAPPNITPGPVDQITAECSEVKAYNASWKPLTTEELNDLPSGSKIRFTVYGESSSGTLDKARFSVNSVSIGETTLKRPGTDEFYIEYTLPENLTNFTVNAQIYHSELGWF